MTYKELQRLIQDLEQYEHDKRQEKESLQNEQKKIDEQLTNIKSEAAEGLANAAKQAAGFSPGAVDSTKKKYQDKQKSKQEEAENMKQRMSELESQLDQVGRILKELKKLEPSYRDLEQKIARWQQEAEQLMGRQSTGLF